MPTQTLAVVGAGCLADSHPSSCTEPAPGAVQEGGSDAITIDGVAVADHGDTMHYPTHAHAYYDINGDGSPECTEMASHDIIPDQTPPITIDGQPVMRVGDDTTDPGSGGRAWIDDAGGNTAITHTH